jgi:Protein of unknown function (DUF3108)
MSANPKRSQKRAGANPIDLFFPRLILASAAFFSALACARADSAPLQSHGIGNGEVLTYSVRWGIIPSIGRIKISADTLGEGSGEVLRVTTTTATWGLARGIFPFDGRGESVYQASSGRLMTSDQWSAYRDKVVKNSVSFDYDKMTAAFTDDIHPDKSRRLVMPEGDPSDLILALIQTRYWNLKPGDKRDALVIFQDQFYQLTIHAQDEPDYVLTSLGLFKATVLVPRMEKTPPLGMFKRGSTVRVWIAQDDPRHLPVRFEVGFKVGTGTATLLEYQPPK